MHKKTPTPVLKHSQDIDLQKWSETPEAISTWRKLLNTPFMQDAIGVMYSQIPASLSTEDHKVTEQQSLIQLGRIQGYLFCMDLIRLMGQFPKEPLENIEADYGYEKYLIQEGLLPKTANAN